MRALKAVTMSLGLAGMLSSSVLAQNVVIFGDSLSDIGQDKWAHKATYNRADGTPNALWSERFTQHWGGDPKASSQGGNIWAYSGGTWVERNASPSTAKASPTIDGQNVVGKQVEAYLKRGVDPSAIHVLWAGGNDMRGILERALTSKDAVSEVKKGAAEVAKATSESLLALRNAGVDTVFIPDVPNIVMSPAFFIVGVSSKTLNWYSTDDVANYYKQYVEKAKREKPEVLNDPQAFRHYFFEQFLTGFLGILVPPKTAIEQYDALVPKASLATTVLNQSVTSAVNAAGGNVIRVPMAALFEDVLRYPKRYGFSDPVRFACNDAVTNVCGLNETNKKQKADPEADQMLFADTFHPGPKLHALASDFMVSLIEVPRAMTGLNASLIENANVFGDVMLTENQTLAEASPTVGQLTGIVRARTTTEGKNTGVFVGGAYRLRPNWEASLLLGRTIAKQDVGSVHLKNQTTGVAGALRYHVSPMFYVGALVEGNAHALSTDRTLQLGAYKARQTGSTDAMTWGAGGFVGASGSIAPVTWSLQGSVRGVWGARRALTEDVNHFTRLTLKREKVKAVESRLKGVLAVPNPTFTPYVLVDWHHTSERKPGVTVELNGSSYRVKAPVAKRHQLEAGLGVRFHPTNQPVRIDLEAKKALGSLQRQGVTVNAALNVSF